jgi:hypothetical protein
MMRLVEGGSIKLSAVLFSPVRRLGETPEMGQAMAVLVGIWQALTSSVFGGALALVLLTSVLDYIVGVKAAKVMGRYQPGIAHAGAMGKITGVLLLLIVRLFEGWVSATGFLETRGGIATALAVSLIAVDFQSIAHHRETFGARPIPFLSSLVAWMQNAAAGKLPPTTPPKPEGEE